LTGDKVYVVEFTLSSSAYTLNISFFQGSQHIFSDSVPAPDNNFFWDKATVTAPGVFKWEVDHNGNPEASITFQVVS
jgi:hypothetical protein